MTGRIALVINIQDNLRNTNLRTDWNNRPSFDNSVIGHHSVELGALDNVPVGVIRIGRPAARPRAVIVGGRHAAPARGIIERDLAAWARLRGRIGAYCALIPCLDAGIQIRILDPMAGSGRDDNERHRREQCRNIATGFGHAISFAPK